jgi:hypothetical protein
MSTMSLKRSPSGVETMTAIVQDAYGGAPEDVLRLAETARPTSGDRGVLVRVRAASVDRGTWHVMAGVPYAMRMAGFGLRAPKAPNPVAASRGPSRGEPHLRAGGGRRRSRH